MGPTRARGMGVSRVRHSRPRALGNRNGSFYEKYSYKITLPRSPHNTHLGWGVLYVKSVEKAGQMFRMLS